MKGGGGDEQSRSSCSPDLCAETAGDEQGASVKRATSDAEEVQAKQNATIEGKKGGPGKAKGGQHGSATRNRR
jgi:hypothetical protein